MKHFISLSLIFSSIMLFSQNKALTFNQTNNNYLNTPYNSAISLTNNFTIEFWMQPSKTSSFSVIFQQGKCNNFSFSYDVIINADSTVALGFNCFGDCNYTNLYKCTTKIYPGVCKHVAITYTQNEIKFYYNGVLQPGMITVGSYCGVLNTSTEPLQTGAYTLYSGGLTSFFDGFLDDIRIWSRILTPSEILANYQEPLIGNESGLKLYYKFDEPILGNGDVVTNYATATGIALNGLTHSTTATSPYNSNSCFLYTGENDIITNYNSISIFPNPTQGKLYIKNKLNIKSIELYNYLGDIILNKLDFKQYESIEININNYPNGIYFVKIYTDENTYLEKIIKN